MTDSSQAVLAFLQIYINMSMQAIGSRTIKNFWGNKDKKEEFVSCWTLTSPLCRLILYGRLVPLCLAIRHTAIT